MSITFDEAVNSLQAMFPSWDRDTLGTMLMTNQGRVERTIEMILSMEGSNDNNNNNNNSSTQAPSSTSDIMLEESTRQQNHPPQELDFLTSSSPSNNHHQPSNLAAPTQRRNSGGYRGIRCELPADFLRLPNHVKIPATPRILADEELAMMLQNEMFQRELMNQGYVGHDGANRGMFWDFGMGNRNTAGASNATSSASTGHGTSQNAQAAAMPDLGIMKSISSMSETAKRNLSNLAHRFTAHHSDTGYQTNDARRPETRRLVGGDDDEDEDEIISFEDTSPSGHFLNGVDEKDKTYWTNNPVLDGRVKKND